MPLENHNKYWSQFWPFVDKFFYFDFHCFFSQKLWNFGLVRSLKFINNSNLTVLLHFIEPLIPRRCARRIIGSNSCSSSINYKPQIKVNNNCRQNQSPCLSINSLSDILKPLWFADENILADGQRRWPAPANWILISADLCSCFRRKTKGGPTMCADYEWRTINLL